MKTIRWIELLVVVLIGFGVTASLSQAQAEASIISEKVQMELTD